MKKIKKSLVVVPALARIARTTVASVSGTVAWFTANRAVTVNASNFGAQTENGALNIALDTNKLVGVVADTDKEQKSSVKMEENNYLTDGSFDFTNVYKKATLDDNGEPVTFESCKTYDEAINTKSNWNVNSDSNTLWYAVSWTWNFTYHFSTIENDRALFFDLGASSMAITDVNGKDRNGNIADSAKHVGTGFRLARQADKEIVWAPKEATNKKHVGTKLDTEYEQFEDAVFKADVDTGSQDGQYYKQASDVNSGDNTFITDSTNSYCYLGTFEAPTVAGDVTIGLVCTAWFEGMDENVINNAVNQLVNTTQKFYVRKTPKAAA